MSMGEFDWVAEGRQHHEAAVSMGEFDWVAAVSMKRIFFCCMCIALVVGCVC